MKKAYQHDISLIFSIKMIPKLLNRHRKKYLSTKVRFWQSVSSSKCVRKNASQIPPQSKYVGLRNAPNYFTRTVYLTQNATSYFSVLTTGLLGPTRRIISF